MYTKIIGADSETYHGEPITFQFYHPEYEFIKWIDNPKNALKLFLQSLDQIAKKAHRDTQHIVYCHNLEFDLVSFFYDRKQVLYDTPRFTFEAYGWRIDGLYGAPSFVQFTKGRQASFFLIDTFCWFPTSLAKLADLFCPDLPKLGMPSMLGRHRYKPGDKKFERYAMRDSEIAFHVGTKIEAVHRQYDIEQTVSGPQMSSRIFRKHFLKEPIPLPPRKIVYSALNSYHGGKNNITVPRGWYGTYSIDISSAYPYAMSQLPSFSVPEAFKFIRGHSTPKEVPALGVYCITGHVKPCPWPALFNHNFKKLEGEFKRIWTTGFELNEAIRCKEVSLTDIEGYFYDTSMDLIASPFKKFVNEFYVLKETASDPIMREFYKRPILNSLYGKFIQARKSGCLFTDLTYDIDDKQLVIDNKMQAGGLFNPFIATLITGHTRAYIHRLEHFYEALHTSTDGIFTSMKPRAKDMRKGLGGLSLEAQGTAVILRNKLYAIYGDEKPKAVQSKVFAGKWIQKYALHGFHARIKEFEELIVTGKRSYQYTRVNKLRESVRRNLQVNEFEQRIASLKLEHEQYGN